MYSYVKKVKESESVEFRKPNCRPVKLGTTEVKNRVRKVFKTHPSTSSAVAARKINISRSYLVKIKVDKLGIKVKAKKPA